MTTVHLKWIAIGVGALLLIWAISALLPSGTDRATAELELPAIPRDSVDHVSIVSSAETVLLVRSDAERWTVNGFPASSATVNELFGALTGHHEPELVAQSPTSFARLGVDSTSARRLTIASNGRALLELLVSERGPDVAAGGAYIRRPGDSAVYAWPGPLAAAARRSAEDWRDRVIAAVSPDSVRRIDVELGAGRYSVRRRDSGWAFAGGRPADSSAVSRLLGRIQSLNATGFPSAAQLDSAFRGRRERRVTLFGGPSGDSTLLALEFDSTADGFWVRRAAGELVYRLGTWEVDQLTPRDTTLRAR
jgi:hypothetical protein